MSIGYRRFSLFLNALAYLTSSVGCAKRAKDQSV